MGEAKRKKLMREVEGIWKLHGTDGDHCTYCKRPYVTRSKTAVGEIDGIMHEVGECCFDKMKSTECVGLYISGEDRRANPGVEDRLMREVQSELAQAIAFGNLTREAERYAGVRPTKINTDQNALWMSDDRQWFESHPHRSHRVRRAYPNETAFKDMVGHHQIIFIRQIRPGARVKTSSYWNDTWETMLDNDELISVCFDLLKDREAVSFSDVADKLRERMAGASRLKQ
jgi:hypothetical protein